MRNEYDFTDARANPYVGKLKKRQVTINLDNRAVEYFKLQSDELGVPYQTLINLYLVDCAKNKRQLAVI